MRLILILVFAFHSAAAFGWGAIGHRAVGEVAWRHLKPKARKQVQQVLGNESLAMACNWMDFIKSEKEYDYTHAWHYVNIPEGKTAFDMPEVPEGEVIGTIERLTNELKSGVFSERDEAFALRCLIHLVGDIHQPLHVGRAEDRGGNDIKIKWFGQESNLHSLWDDGIISRQNLSYTEWATHIDHASPEEIKAWQNNSPRTWAEESRELAEKIYKVPNNGDLRYRYSYDYIATVEQQLLKAGIRLAGLLNFIYG